MQKVIILNAPPGAGKDTIGRMIAEKYECDLFCFKQPMFDIALAMLGSNRFSIFMDAYDDRERKEKPLDILNGKSPRQFMIWISEDVIKPQFGADYFGRRVAEEVRKFGTVVCTDGGFEDEVIALINAGINVSLYRLHRSGYAFDGDSRDYIYLHRKYFDDGYNEYDGRLIDWRPEIAVDKIARIELLTRRH